MFLPDLTGNDKINKYYKSDRQIENVLNEIEGVLEAAVIGVDDEILGQAVKAFIVVEDPIKTTREQIIDYCYHELEEYAVPKYVSFCESLPKTESGKILKKDLI